jgi:hypothetical protein
MFMLTMNWFSTLIIVIWFFFWKETREFNDGNMESILGLIIIFKWQDFILKLNTLFYFVDRVHEIWLAFDLPCDICMFMV